MKKVFIPVKNKTNANLEKIKQLSKKLPKNLIIAYSIQFIELAKQIKNTLKNKNISFFQVLGCSIPKTKNKQAILLIGSGKFHAISLAYETKLPVYLLQKDKLEKISKKEIELIEKKHKAAYLKYLYSKKIGVLISNKPGQTRLKQALKLKNKIKNKKTYFFLSSTLNKLEFENFNLDSWINTSCPRLDMDFPIINIGKLNLCN